MEDRGGEQLLRLIEKATNSTDREVDPRVLKAIKSTVRSSDDEVRIAAHALMEKMKKEHSQVRYLAILIIDELFMRSKLFRTLLVLNFDQFLSLGVGFRRNLPLPPPASIASLLRSTSIELLEKWNSSFGVHYRQLRLGFDYLKNTLKFQFPNLLENEARLRRERREREIRSREILQTKFENMKENFSSTKSEIQSTLDQLGECLDIIYVGGDECNLNIMVEDDDFIEFKSSALRQIRLDALKEGAKVHESNDNKAVFDAMRELYKLLVSKHLQTVQDCISILVRIDLPDNRFRDSALKELIDIRNLIRSAQKRCEESGCILQDPIDNEEDIWEEDKVEAYEPKTSATLNEATINCSANDRTNIRDKGKAPFDHEKSNNQINIKDKGKAPFDHEESSERHECETTIRSKLLAEAPVVTWGTYLDVWGPNRDALANQRGLELENHWGRVDQDAVIPADKIAELNYHVTAYKEPPVQTHACLAPLRKGGLCQRRDLRVCPFHGPIVPRDAAGNPTEGESAEQKASMKNEIEDYSSEQEECANQKVSMKDEIAEDFSEQATILRKTNLTSDSDKELTKKLAEQALKNVRQRENDLKALKRAKLAKVRQHNEAVLREAAMASTSYSESFGGDATTRYQDRNGAKAKKPTLASMLRKKITAKDRLAQRLLSSRATDSATRQVTQGEDAKYREAYPNQW